MDELKKELEHLIQIATIEKNKAEQAGEIMSRMEWQGRIIGLYDALKVVDRLVTK